MAKMNTGEGHERRTGKKPPFNARGMALQAMVAKDVLTDESMPQEKMQIFYDKALKD